jgi:uncharacterized circularly permuted ATP-grasp superfamily protein/uncharacterized alpha-E superfamily protein
MTPTATSPGASRDANPWHDYQGRPGCFDEMTTGDGQLREHWRKFVAGLDALGPAELMRRWQEARELIRENGVTYNVYADPQGMDRPWQLDPLPLVLSPAEWGKIEAGLVQRARLLELILADVYGAQHLLRQGLLPPELLFAHPHFLRPCHGIILPNKRHLHLYAADLGRTPDGGVWVLGDRTQAPSGAGYSLENRIVLSGMLPGAFRDCQVQRLALFFRSLRDNLASLAPRHRDDPRIVLLTPGPYNETYFEHAYLARYLGLTLVEGGDLTVRDHRVYLKLLGGLQPVDVILRRLDDTFCDPLELWRDSFLGVPGLVQAARAGNVALANPLGSGVVQTPALNVFLPAICRHLLGEELLLPSTPTYWCADAVARDYVLANLHRLVIKSSFPAPGRQSIFGSKLDAAARQKLAEAIQARPRDYVGQEQLTLSTAPVMVDGRLQPRHLVVRALLTASEGSFTVMPGGLTRFSGSADSLVVSLQHGGGSKDTWVLSSGPVSSFSLLPPPGQPIELSRGGGDLPSRAADDLFWLGRYAERAEGMVRLLRGILVRLTEKSGLSDAPELPLLLRALLHPVTGYGAAGEGGEVRPASLEAELLSLVFDGQRPGSLRDTVASLRRVAGCVRDRISLDTWRILRGLDLQEELAQLVPGLVRPGEPGRANAFRDEEGGNGRAGAAPRWATASDVVALLNQMVIRLAAFCGMAMEGMTRGHGWRFLDMGRRLERSIQLIRLIRNTLRTVSVSEGPLLEAVLEISDSSMTYRRRYLAGLQAAPVLDLLLADETNPRSLVFQLAALADHVERLPREQKWVSLSPEKRIILSALTGVRLADVEALSQGNADGVREQLDALLADLDGKLPLLCDSITRGYLSHAEPLQQRALLQPGGTP